VTLGSVDGPYRAENERVAPLARAYAEGLAVELGEAVEARAARDRGAPFAVTARAAHDGLRAGHVK
jgi:hypothetical protein